MSELLVDALDDAYGAIVATLDNRRPSDFEQPTRATAWTVKELLFHLSQDAVRALVAFADLADEPPDVDAVSYWRPFRPGRGDDRSEHERFVRVSASAYEHHQALLQSSARVASSAVRAARGADPSARVRTQGHVLAVPDFVSTLLVEATIHHLDLIVDLPDPPDVQPPTVAGLGETRRVLEGILGAPLPATWDDTEAALKATGRIPLTDADRSDLGDRAAAIPLLG